MVEFFLKIKGYFENFFLKCVYWPKWQVQTDKEFWYINVNFILLSCCHSYEFSKWAWLVTCFWKDYLFLLFVSNNCRIKNNFFKNMKIDVVKIIYSSKLRHWKIALRRLSWNCVDKWPNSVQRRHKKMELVLHRFMLFALKFCGDMKYFARLNW